MLELIRAHQFVTVRELSRRFGVSEVTVRADLHALASAGLIERFGGGATQRRPSTRRSATDVATAAARLVRDRDSVLLDAGPMSAQIVTAVARRHDLTEVVLFVNSVAPALALAEMDSNLAVVVLAGRLRSAEAPLAGPEAARALEHIHVDMLFLRCDGIHPQAGATCGDPERAALRRAMVSVSRRVIACADADAVGRIQSAVVCPASRVEIVVTPASIAPFHEPAP